MVLLDALDETEQQGAVAGQLVTELARHGLRLLIGTREHLLQAIASHSLLIDLDNEPYADTQALTDYVTQLLVAGQEPGITTPYQPLQHHDDDTLATIAAAISAKAALVPDRPARRAGAAGPRPSCRPGQLDDIPASVGEAFDADLARLGTRAAYARVLLTALAWAKGPGLPWENIWVPVANAIRPTLAERTPRADPPSRNAHPEPLRDADIRWLRDQAGAYIIEDTGPGGRSVFRPFHDLLAAHLRATGQAPGRRTVFRRSPSAGQPPRHRHAARRRASRRNRSPALGAGAPIPANLLGTARRRRGTGALLALLTGEPDYLAAADPATLLPLLLREQPPELAETSGVYRRAVPLLGTDVRWNAAYLQEAALALKARGLWEAFAADRLAPAFDTVIAQHTTDTSLLALTGHAGRVWALAAVPLPGGQALLASGAKTERCGCGTRPPARRPGRR